MKTYTDGPPAVELQIVMFKKTESCMKDLCNICLTFQAHEKSFSAYRHFLTSRSGRKRDSETVAMLSNGQFAKLNKRPWPRRGCDYKTFYRISFSAIRDTKMITIWPY